MKENWWKEDKNSIGFPWCWGVQEGQPDHDSCRVSFYHELGTGERAFIPMHDVRHTLLPLQVLALLCFIVPLLALVLRSNVVMIVLLGASC